MAWNNGLERKRFDEEQERLAAEYCAAGMTEEQIKQMHQFDLKVFNSTRRFFEHNQQIPDNIFGTDDEGLCPLNDKFLEAMSVTIEQSEAKSRYWWIEEIDDAELALTVRRLPAEDLELITLYVFDKFTVREVATEMGISKSTVSQRLDRLRNFLKNFS